MGAARLPTIPLLTSDAFASVLPGSRSILQSGPGAQIESSAVEAAYDYLPVQPLSLGPSRVSVCAVRTLNAAGQSRVTLSLR